jgi:hypothetical protein
MFFETILLEALPLHDFKKYSGSTKCMADGTPVLISPVTHLIGTQTEFNNGTHGF